MHVVQTMEIPELCTMTAENPEKDGVTSSHFIHAKASQN